MTDRAHANQRVLVALNAARSARRRLEDAMASLRRSPELPQAPGSVSTELAGAMNALFRAETGGVDHVRTCLASAMDHLGAALATLHGSMVRHAAVETVMIHVARTLAVLYPAQKFLDRSTEPSQEIAIPLRPSPSEEAGMDDIAEESVDPREMPRQALDVAIGVQSETNFFTGYAGDLSDGGLFIATYSIQPIGTPLSLSFVLPGGRQVNADARVAWVREPVDLGSEFHPGMGVTFESLQEEDKNAVLQFMRQRPPLFYDA